MKRSLLALALVHVVLFTGCQQHRIANESVNMEPSKNAYDISNTTTKISIDSVKGLSSDEVISICQKVIGIKDDENFMFQMAEKHTGRDIGYRCDGAFESDGKQYYILCMLWSNNDDSVWSSIGFLGVSSYGDKIHELFVHSDGSCSLGEIIWEKGTQGNDSVVLTD